MPVPSRHHTPATHLPQSWHGAARLGAGVVAALWLCLPQAAEVLPRSETRLGTLFYSAAERSSINQARLAAVSGAAGVSAANVVSINGIVKRQGGKSTAWVNGQAVNENQPLPAAIGTAAISAAGIVLNGKSVRVGETLDLTTQERHDIVLPGAVKPKGAP